MIALVSLALAGPVDLMVEYPFLRTPPVYVQTEVNDPFLGPQREGLKPEARPLNGSVFGEVELEDLGRASLVLGAGFQGFAARWVQEDFDFGARVWDVQADVGYRSEVETGPGAALATPYVAAGAGARVSIFVPDYWDTHVTPAPQGYAALGIVTRGDPGLRVELRARVAARIDYYRGRAQLPEDALRWTFHPGAASIGLGVGLHFGRSRERVEVTSEVEEEETPGAG